MRVVWREARAGGADVWVKSGETCGDGGGSGGFDGAVVLLPPSKI
jgi:hypothetical protein